MAGQNMKLPDSFDLTPKAAHKLEQLRLLAIEHQTICQQAPDIMESGVAWRLMKDGHLDAGSNPFLNLHKL